MKRMIESKNGVWYINSSSVEIIQTCKRKAKYALVDNLRKEDESDALTFGSAIHEALAAFYNSQRDYDYICKIFENRAKPLAHLVDDKRSIENGKKILKKYFEVYKDDPWTIFYDKDGPFVERSFELKLNDGIVVHGTIDCILKNIETGELVICDHKTTSTIGSDFINRANPNTQFTIYAWAANQLGIPVDRVMVNGIQVAKTKCDLARIFTARTKDHFEEMENIIIDSVHQMNINISSKRWPMNSGACSNWGGCQYLEICQSVNAYKQVMIESLYGL